MFRCPFAVQRLRRAPRRDSRPQLESLEDRLAPAGYSLTDLGAMGVPRAINNSGQVVAAADDSSGNTQVFLYSNGQVSDLHAPSGYTTTSPIGINDSGQLFVDSKTKLLTSHQVFQYNFGNGQWLDWGPSETLDYSPVAVNNSGQILCSVQSFSEDYPIVYNGGWYNLFAGGVPSGYSSIQSLGLNNSGHILVNATTVSGSSAFFLSDISGHATKLGANPWGSSIVNGAINNNGQAALETIAVNALGATFDVILYNFSGGSTDLGTLLPSGYSDPTLVGINDAGQILADAQVGGSSSTVSHPLLYSNGQWTDLNSFFPGNTVTLIGPAILFGSSTGTSDGGINNQGQMVVDGSDGHVYLLTPQQQQGTPPAVTTNPSNQAVTAGGTATFTASANGDPTPTAQWKVSSDGGNTWSNIANPVTGHSVWLTLTNVTTDMNGYEYEAFFSNSAGSVTTSAATLTVNPAASAPAITSDSSTAFTVGQSSRYTVTATGSPTPALTESGALPDGIAFTDNGDGTATLAGTPAAGTQGTYYFTITAHNGVGSDFTQNFALTVNAASTPPPPSSPSAPPAPPQPTPPSALHVPPLLALLDGLLGGTETVNGNDTETITDSLFGITLFVSTFDNTGNLISVTLFGFNVTFLFA